MSHDSASLETQGRDRGRQVRKARTINSPQVGFEPTTSQLTADRSTTELLRNNGLKLRKPTLVLWTPTYDRTKKCSSLFFTYTGRKGYDSKPLLGRRASIQDKGAAVNHPLSRFILINRSPRPASSLSRLTLPRVRKERDFSCQRQGTQYSSQELAGMIASLSLRVYTTKQHFCYSIIEQIPIKLKDERKKPYIYY